MKSKRKKLKYKLLSVVLIVAITVSSFLQLAVSKAEANNKDLFEGKGYQVVFSITSRWANGYIAEITIKNTGENNIDNWCIAFQLENSIADIWNAKLDSSGDGKYIVKNNQYNQDIKVDESVTFGILVNEPFKQFPYDYTMLGHPWVAEEDCYSIKYVVNDDWGSGFSASLIISNTSDYDFEDWALRGRYENEIDTIWNGQIRYHENNQYVISGSEYKQNLCAGEYISINFNCIGGNSSVGFEKLDLTFIKTSVLYR